MTIPDDVLIPQNMLPAASSPPIPSEPYPELRPVLETFVSLVSAALGDALVGIYLVGSLATGDFDLDSDVDFLVVTRADLSEAQMQPLQAIQVQVHALGSYPARHLEGSYISLHDLNDWSTVGVKDLFYFDNGSTVLERNTHDNQWHVRWILRQRGLTLAGAPPETLLPLIPPDSMRAEVRAAMQRLVPLFQAELDRPVNFSNSRFGQSFYVLTCCRMLHTLQTGTVQSKKAGVAWARVFVDLGWVPLIDEAWQERQGVRHGLKVGQKADPAALHATLGFLQYAITQVDRACPPSS